MKAFFSFAFILAAPFIATAQLADLATDCRARAESYVAAGPMDVDFVGVRTWNLIKMKADAASAADDKCLQNLKTTAFTEAKDYWRHIALKYDCLNEQNELPEERPAACAQTKYAAIQQNLQYISNLEDTDSEASTGTSDGPKDNEGAEEAPASTNVRGRGDSTEAQAGCVACDTKNVRKVHRIIPKKLSPADPCAKFNIPYKYRATTPNAGTDKKSMLNSNGSLGGAVGACVDGVADGFSSLISFAGSSLAAIVKTLTDRQAAAAFGASMSEFMTAMYYVATNPVAAERFRKTLTQVMISSVSKGWEQHQCQNGDGKLAFICGILTGAKAGMVGGKWTAQILARGLRSAMLAASSVRTASPFAKWGSELRKVVGLLEGPKPPAPGAPTVVSGAMRRPLPPPRPARPPATASVVAAQRTTIDNILKHKGIDFNSKGVSREAKEILGLDPKSKPTIAEINTAARALQRRVHPDLVDASLKKSAGEALDIVTKSQNYLRWLYK